MRPQSIYPTDRPLPRPNGADGRSHLSDSLNIDAAQFAAFDALLRDIYPEAEQVDAARVSQLAAWLLSLPEAEARDVLDERLSRIEELRAMVEDPDWDCAEADCASVRKLLRYLDQPDDLITDTIPLLGQLDDVLLLELAWPAVAAEAEEYRDFRLYRDTLHPDGDGAQRRAAWIGDRMAAISILHRRMRPNDGLHLDDRQRGQRFRVA
ncbi:DUF1232 domain-containing protein [Luteimonas sp. SX5]|uniref:DUF1232 domain-containing protein n=1 Tax=Luteimonas galliterrae TaxID=2940486 RepID=A0ABT0ME60_9GAMM|nr:DUF1232 domain-containing protein [Luteimonas galliterrae]MCL1633155.1 DUF1232 domain-containing protein [Luteimonas galliterrae]